MRARILAVTALIASGMIAVAIIAESLSNSSASQKLQLPI